MQSYTKCMMGAVAKSWGIKCHFLPNHMAGASKTKMLISLMSPVQVKIGEANTDD